MKCCFCAETFFASRNFQKFLSSRRDKQNLSVNVQDLCGFHFSFLFESVEEGSLFLRTRL